MEEGVRREEIEWELVVVTVGLLDCIKGMMRRLMEVDWPMGCLIRGLCSSSNKVTEAEQEHSQEAIRIIRLNSRGTLVHNHMLKSSLSWELQVDTEGCHPRAMAEATDMEQDR